MLQNQLQSLEDMVSRLPLLLNILETRTSHNPQILDITCRYLDCFATDLRKRAAADKNATVFTVPDR